jgi:hypothetical protein
MRIKGYSVETILLVPIMKRELENFAQGVSETCKNDKLLRYGSYIYEYLGIGRQMDCIQQPRPVRATPRWKPKTPLNPVFIMYPMDRNKEPVVH